ncbi:Fc receptor-like protein 3, partial [Clarias gariepinus]|uniref:Fc receptor-like protein 3 n=1 Tax=Clarias gariepinus TaxID=13013 RepID=UPI00234C03FD
SSSSSNIIIISVTERPLAVLSVSPQNWLTEGDSVTLSCEVTDSSTDWTFSWYRVVLSRDINGNIKHKVVLLSDSSRGSGGSYTLDPAALKHTAVYMCRGERGEPALHIQYSFPQPLWITGESLPVSLIINPNRTQHFTGDSLSLSCEDQSNSTGWTVRHYTQNRGLLFCSQWGSVTGSRCNISPLSTSDTGVYWCESESGENSNPVNITVHDGDVMLDSPVHPVTEGHPLTLRCLDHNTKSANLQADFYKDGSVLQKQTTGEMIIHKVSNSNEGFYHCKHPEKGESPKSWVSVRCVKVPFSVLMLVSSLMTAFPYLLVTIILLLKCYRAQESLKPVVTIKPDEHVYSGERVTFKCNIQVGESIMWTSSWYKNNKSLHTEGEDRVYTDSTMQKISIRSVRDSDSGVYTCRLRNENQSLEISDPVTLTISERPRPVLSVSPQSWVTEGDSVTLNCEVTDSSTNWTFRWYKLIPYRDNNGHIRYDIVLLSDSSRGSGGAYILSPAAFKHSGVYVSRGERGEPAFQTQYSNPHALYITGESPPVFLIINPSRTQHFTGDSLTLSCEDQRHSTGWTVRRYTHSEGVLDCSRWGSVTGSKCNIGSLFKSHTGVYWCESESGENSNPVNITAHVGNVILESPVHPVTEGHALTLCCLYRNTNSSKLRAYFYKDGSVLQTQTTEEMPLHNFSKSDEGFYHCKSQDRGASQKSWVSVRVSGPTDVDVAPFSVLMLISSVVTASPYLLVTFILLIKCYRARGENSQEHNNFDNTSL